VCVCVFVLTEMQLNAELRAFGASDVCNVLQ